MICHRLLAKAKFRAAELLLLELSELPVSLLHDLVQLLLRRVPTAEDIIYTLQELQEGYKAKVHIPILQKLPVCEGDVAPTRR